jgi:uncharacterized protein YndB with AHSA1/START domain
MTIAPIRRSVHTKAPPQKAFEIFTGQIGRWWPKGRGVGAQPPVDIVVEPGVGGRWFERDVDGQETQWGEVLVWAPPTQLVLAWQLDRSHRYDPDLVTEVELTFSAAEGGGTDVTLEHRNLERFGQDAAKFAASIGGGWAEMLPRFAAFADLPDQEE